MSWLTEPPNRFSPRQSLIDYIERSKTHPGRDDPDLKQEAARVQGYLDEADRKAAASAKN